MDNYSVILLAGITPVLKDIHLEKTSHSVDMWRYPLSLCTHTHITIIALFSSLYFFSGQVWWWGEEGHLWTCWTHSRISKVLPFVTMGQFPAHRKQPLIEEKGKEPTEKKWIHYYSIEALLEIEV